VIKLSFDFDDFFDLELEDFAIVGGVIGAVEEEMTEQRRIERELEKDMESVDEFDDNDILEPLDDDPYP
jgi:hypothetical protein